jgi:hypothetical protein
VKELAIQQVKEPLLKSSTRSETRTRSTIAKERGSIEQRVLLLSSVLITLLAIGYLLYSKNEYSQKSADKKPYSVDKVQDKQDIEKGRNVSLKITKAKLQLESIDNTDRIRVIIDENQDSKKSVRYKYEWFKNSKPLGVNDDNITGFKKGDNIDVKITPIDGKQYGQPVLLNMNIVRVPPKIVENKTVSFDGNTLSHQVKAVDPDGGTLSYSLVDAPKDMTIDSESGIIKWHVKTEEYGKHNVNVMIKNSAGAEVIYPLSIDIGKVNE